MSADPKAWPSGAPPFASFKIAPRRVSADDCPTTVGAVVENGAVVEPGETYYLHQGESVWLLPVGTVQMQLAAMRLATAGAELAAIEGDQEGQLVGLAAINAGLTGLARAVAERVVAWDWTDIRGEPLPQPYRSSATLLNLEASELHWLSTASTLGETEAERKNGSAPLPTGSTAGARSARRRTSR